MPRRNYFIFQSKKELKKKDNKNSYSGFTDRYGNELNLSDNRWGFNYSRKLLQDRSLTSAIIADYGKEVFERNHKNTKDFIKERFNPLYNLALIAERRLISSKRVDTDLENVHNSIIRELTSHKFINEFRENIARSMLNCLHYNPKSSHNYNLLI